MFRRRDRESAPPSPPAPAERVTSVLGSGIIWKGNMNGTGGVRIEGAFEGEIALRGMLVVGATGRVTCQNLRADVVIVAGHVKGNITADKLTIRTGGRVLGDVVVTTFSTEEGAFLKGTIEMQDEVDLGEAAAVPVEITPIETSAAEPPLAETPLIETPPAETFPAEVPSPEEEVPPVDEGPEPLEAGQPPKARRKSTKAAKE